MHWNSRVDPAFYQTNWFRVFAVSPFGAGVGGLPAPCPAVASGFALTLETRVRERTSIARELHDTLLQSFQGLMLRFEIVSQLLPDRPIEAKERLEGAMKQAADAIAEGRDAVQGLRASTLQTNDLARRSIRWARSSQMIRATTALRHFASLLKARREICIRSCAMKSTGSQLRR